MTNMAVNGETELKLLNGMFFFIFAALFTDESLEESQFSTAGTVIIIFIDFPTCALFS